MVYAMTTVSVRGLTLTGVGGLDTNTFALCWQILDFVEHRCIAKYVYKTTTLIVN